MVEISLHGMSEIIQESVTIATALTHHTVVPSTMRWKQRTYTFLSCGMHYSRFEGDVLLHIFSMITDNACMQIILNTKTLRWTLKEIESV